MALLTLLVCFCLVFTACDSGETNGSTNQGTTQSSTGGNTQNSGGGSNGSTQDSTDSSQGGEDVTPNSYDVTFDTQGGSEISAQRVTHGNLISVPTNPTKDGYIFFGWYKEADLINKWSFATEAVAENITLYARWVSENDAQGSVITSAPSFEMKDKELYLEIPNAQENVVISELVEVSPYATYIVTIDIEGKEEIPSGTVPVSVGDTTFYILVTSGTGSNKTQYTVNVHRRLMLNVTYDFNNGSENVTEAFEEDSKITTKEASKTGYTFVEWQYNDSAWDFENGVILDNMTLEAVYTANEYTVSFNSNGGTEIENATVTFDAQYTFEAPERLGYTFDGWRNSKGDLLTDAQGKGKTAWNVAEDTALFAQWTPIDYEITYHNVDGATNNNITTYDVDDQPLALVDASKDHYTFLGWYSDAEFNNEVTEISVGTTGPVMLYAKWEAVEYTITFLYDNEIGDYAEGTVVKTIYTVEDEFEFAPLLCKTAGYTFSGWFTEKNVGTGTKVTGVTKGTSGNITVYAQFGLEEYDITYNNVNGATNNNPTHYNAASEDFTIYPLTKEGYTFNGWFTNEECTTPANLTITKGSNGDITLYAKWTPITYTIEYVTYGGTATGNPATYIITDNITFNNATLSGYVFKGWYTAAEGGSKVTGITAGTTGNIILYAHWDYVSTITFESNGGSPVNSISNVEGTAISAPVAPTKEHYTFTGWYSDAALKNAYSFATQPAEDITLYAKWTPVVYEIEYVLNGGTNSENNVVEYTVEDKIELYAPSKVGYTFIGWFTDAEFTSSVVTELKVGTSGKITLYAHYSVNQYTISFESNGGTSVSAITQNYETSVTAPEAPSKIGYTFVGWYSNASLTSKYTFSTMPADNITLYAKWNLETYNITYNLNGGTNNSSNPATYTITSAKITLKAPTKIGYSFAGWYTDAECTEAITEIASGSYGVVELFAKWTATEYTITYVTADGATHSNILTYTIETDLTTLADATLKGHAFGGWYTDDSYATAVTTVAGGEIGNKTVYAKFTANTYNVWLDGNEEASCVVSFNLNGADGTIASQTVTPTATLKYPTVPTRDGYIFAGWYDNENCTGSLYDFTTVVTSDTTLYAKWVTVENATAIAINGSSNVTLNGKYEQMLMFVPLVSGNITITASGSYDTFGVLYNSEMVALVQDDDNASDGVNFLIVYNVTAGETYYIGTRAFSSTTTGTATVSIAGSTTVLDGGYAITASKATATYGQNFTVSVPDARDGYKFLGYADENGVMYTDATGASVKAWDKDSETTLYSVWERTVYTITFITSGGSAIDSVELAYGERIDIGKYATTRSGYSFNGWYLDGAEYNATTMPDHDITLTAYWKTFALGAIKYDIDKIAVSVDDEITADLFSAICLDTDGNLATFTITVSGTQTAGETISVRLVAKSGNKTKQITISDIKVYGDPTLTFNNDVDYFNIKDGLNAAWFSASGTDSFGNPTTILVYVDSDYEAGDFVTVTIESRDAAGNSTHGYIDNVKVYGLPEIIYNSDKNVIGENDALNANLFNASAKDSFGENVTVTVSLYSGTISAGNTVTLRISATDSKGNTKNIDVQCKVYSAPTISDANKTDVRVSDTITAELLGITAIDTYGENVAVSIIIKEGLQNAGTIMTVTARAIDVAGNVAAKDYKLKVYGTPSISYDREEIKLTEDPLELTSVTVSFDLNGAKGKVEKQIVTSESPLQYPETIPTRSGYAFSGWYTTPDCSKLYDFSQNVDIDTVVYAGWTPMVQSGYADRMYMNILSYCNSSSYYTYYVEGRSETSCDFTYFTALVDANYTLYYQGTYACNSYYYVYNVTQDKVIQENTSLMGGTGWRSVSFDANQGDVLYVRTYTPANVSCTLHMYVTSTEAPKDGGLSNRQQAEYVLNVSATDSFGKPVQITATLTDGNLKGGEYVKYLISAIDHLGNTSSLETKYIPVYDANDIDLTYFEGMSDLIKLSSMGEEFAAVATDSFGNSCNLSIEAAEGYTLAGGNIISLHIVATDKAGNRVAGGTIEGIKVYDEPEVLINQDNRVITESTDINFLFTVKDSFGEELYAEISTQDDIIVGNTVSILVTATDDAGNNIEKSYTFGVMSSEKYFVELYINNELWQTMFVDSPTEFSLPIPELPLGMEVIGWVDTNNNAYTDALGNSLISLSSNVQLHLASCKSGYTPIYTAEELKAISLDGNYCLMNDLNLNGAEWTPIGTSSSPFIGNFDGNGYIISNFKITADANYIGLFGYSKGVIENLGVKNISIKINSTTGTHYVGGIAGLSEGTIINCYTTGTISSSASNYELSQSGYNYSYVGGVVGANNGSISNCYSTATISSSASTSSRYTTFAYAYAGGLVGINQGVVTNSFATGNITCLSKAKSSTYCYAGGLIGHNYNGTVTNCYRYSEQQISASHIRNGETIVATPNTLGTPIDITNLQSKEWIENNLWTAEIAIWDFSNGYPELNHNSLKNTIVEIYTKEQLLKLNGQSLVLNYVLMNNIDLNRTEWIPIGVFGGSFDGNGYSISNYVITASTTYSGLIGSNIGIITDLIVEKVIINLDITGASSGNGFSSSYVYSGLLVAHNLGTINNCSSFGEITVLYSSTYTYDQARLFIGGLVGRNDGFVSDGFAKADIVATASVGFYASSYVHIGGLVGYNNGTIEDSCAIGDVTGNGDINMRDSYNCYVGGLVGYNVSNISRSYATGNVNSYAMSAYSGGLVGYNSGNISDCYATGASIAKSSATSSSDGADTYVGGLVAYNSGSITNSYSNGDAISNSQSGSETSYSYAGGLVGYNYSGTVTNCYATGNLDVTVVALGTSNSYIGGLIGYSNKTTGTNSYRSEGQIITTSTTFTEYEKGEPININTITTKEFLADTLGWSMDIWSFVDGEYPTLK